MRKRTCLAVAVTCAVVFGSSLVQAETPDEVLELLRKSPDNLSLLMKLKESLPSITNVQQRCRLGTLYCAGTLAFGNVIEALSIRGKIERAFPTYTGVAELSDSNIKVGCQKCGATGKTTENCSKCAGSGVCPICNGKGGNGMVFNGQKLRCLPCSGTGHCVNCSGTGLVAQPCGICGRSGQAVSRKKSMECYFRLLVPDKKIAETLMAKEEQNEILQEGNKASVMQSVNKAGSAAATSVGQNDDPFRPNPAKDKLQEIANREATKVFLSSMNDQIARSSLLQQYGISNEEVRGVLSDGVTDFQKDANMQKLWDRAKIDGKGTRRLFMPFPNGLKYKIDDVKGFGDGAHFAVSLIAVDSEYQSAQRAFDGFMGLECVCLAMPPVEGFDPGTLKKGRIIVSDGWILGVLVVWNKGARERILEQCPEVLRSEKDLAFFERRLIGEGSEKNRTHEAEGLGQTQLGNSQTQPGLASAVTPNDRQSNFDIIDALEAECQALRFEIDSIREAASATSKFSKNMALTSQVVAKNRVLASKLAEIERLKAASR